MKTLRLGAGILNQTPLDWTGNTARIMEAVDTARRKQVNVLCLPELCITGYGCEDMFLSPNTWQQAWRQLEIIAPATHGMLVAVGLPLFITNGVYNVACVLSDGRICGFVPKQHLAGDGLHYEPRWFKAWPAQVCTDYHRGSESWPVGDLIFECDDVRFGFEICEDAWVAGRPGNRMAESGVDVILNPSASHFAFDKHETRKRFVLEGSRAFGVSYIYANLVGNEAGRAIYDGGAMIASAGELIATGERLPFCAVDVTVADVDVDLTRSRRASVHSLSTNVTDDLHDHLAQIAGTLAPPTERLQPTVDHARPSKADEFTQAIGLALFDYLRKSYSRGFVVSMSGGADSSAVACLIRCMAELAIRQLGLEGFARQLPWLPELASATTVEQAMARLLTGVYQGTRNSSDITRSAAADVTRGMGGRFHELDVDPLVAGYTQTVERAIGRDLTWQQDDITLQNIQARTRSPAIWMFANIQNALLLSTSNRSEAAVGYATMDGDTSGGLSPIAGIDKAFLREWLRIMETDGAAGCGPFPALQAVNVQQPTAELRPAEYEQTDEGDLMPYPLLDEIESLAIGDKRSPQEVLDVIAVTHPQYDRPQLIVWVTRFFQLWCRNQWKRERYAPSFHVDDKNLDPRTWCRFPILSSGFQSELSALS